MTGTRLVEWASGHEWSRETRRSVYNSVRGFFRWAVAEGYVPADPTGSLPPIKAPPPKPRPAPDTAYHDALSRADARTRLILRMAGEAGLRRAEIAQVSRSDLVEDLEGWSLTVHGKGEKDRLVPLPAGLSVEVRSACLAGGGWMLPSRNSGNHLLPRRVGELASQVLPPGWTLHTLRHRFATLAYRGSGDLLAVQQLLGHTSPTTTQRYVAVDQARLRRAAEYAA